MLRALVSRIPKSICSIKSESPLINVAFVRKESNEALSEEGSYSPLENVDTSKCLNRVTLLGRATGPPVTTRIHDSEVTLFTLATNELRRNKANETIKRTEFHRVIVFIPQLGSKAKQVMLKGSRLLVEGKINYNIRQGENGQRTQFTNIIADNIVFITGKKQNRNLLSDDESGNIADEESEVKQ